MSALIAPGAVWRPVVNHGGPLEANRGLVVHVQDGTGSLFDWFNNPAPGGNPAAAVSAHFWVSYVGLLEQYVSADTQAWAEAAGNPYYLSLETEGRPDEPLTPAQLATIRDLYAWGQAEFGWPLQMCVHGGRGLTTHANYPSGIPDPAWGNHSCPGAVRAAQLPSILTVTPPAPPAPPQGEPVYLIQVGNVDKADAGGAAFYQVFDNGKVAEVDDPSYGSGLANKPTDTPAGLGVLIIQSTRAQVAKIAAGYTPPV